MSSTVNPLDASDFNRAQARRTEVTLAGYAGNETPVRRGLNDADPTVRAAALSALDRLGALTAIDVSQALSDDDLRVRRRACELSTLIPITASASHEIDATLLRFLQTGDETMAELGAWSLGERHQQPSDNIEDQNENDASENTESETSESGKGSKGGEEIVRALAEAVYNHPDALVREAAVAALGCIGTPSAKAPILHAIGDKATVRRRAVIALASFEGADVEAVLSQATTDRDWQVRQAAEDLLA